MNKFDLKERSLAVSLSALAGYVDAVGFINSGGFFVSFMSGNTTRLSVGIVETTLAALATGALIAAFVLGVAAGSILGFVAQARRSLVILLFMAGIIAFAALAGSYHQPWVLIMLLAFAMGAENAIFEREGEAFVSLTYMTGSLVRIGHGLAGFAIRQKRSGWFIYGLLWAGLTTGAITGAVAYRYFNEASIWLACGYTLILALVVWTSRYSKA